jgi:Zn-dependent protease with chaperone function
MSSVQEANRSIELKPLPYHEAIRAYLKAEQPETWNWYASNRVREEQAEAVRFDLLKSTYRVERPSQSEIYATAESVAQRLGLTVPVTVYQAQNPAGLNASLAYVPSDAHIVLHGPVCSKLAEGELRALLAHELSHLLLWQCCDGEYLVVDQVLAALSHDTLADTPHFASARLFGLYNEVFCDRGALAVVGDPLVVVSMLLKVHTELDDVSPESYLRQAEEILGRGPVRANELTHPEAFIRALALQLWATGAPEADAKIAAMIEGPLSLDGLDLLGQKRAAGLTRRLVDAILAPRWMQTDLVLAHARLFFDDYAAPDSGEDLSLAEELRTDDAGMSDYYCYVLLDFVTVDRDLEELPLAAALTLVERLGLKDRFVEIAQRELRLRKKQLEKIDQDKEGLLARAKKDTVSR